MKIIYDTSQNKISYYQLVNSVHPLFLDLAPFDVNIGSISRFKD